MFIPNLLKVLSLLLEDEGFYSQLTCKLINSLKPFYLKALYFN